MKAMKMKEFERNNCVMRFVAFDFSRQKTIY